MGFKYTAEIEIIGKSNQFSNIFHPDFRIVLHEFFCHVQAKLSHISAGSDIVLCFEQGGYIFLVQIEKILKYLICNLCGKVLIQPFFDLLCQGLLIPSGKIIRISQILVYFVQDCFFQVGVCLAGSDNFINIGYKLSMRLNGNLFQSIEKIVKICYKLELCDFVFIPETCHGSEAVGDLLSFDVFTKVRTDLSDFRGRCNISIGFRFDMEYTLWSGDGSSKLNKNGHADLGHLQGIKGSCL